MEKIAARATTSMITGLLSASRSLGFLSPGACRYTPTCSAYAQQALEKHSFLRAIGLILRRLVRCNPFFQGGYDPLPEPPVKGHSL